MQFPYIPKELVNIILEFDGQIKYRKGEYVNIIHKHDTRYKVFEPVINKKLKIMKTIEIGRDGKGFYFDFQFDGLNEVGLCYDCNFSWHDTFEICYYDFRGSYGHSQMRTVL